MSRKLLRSLNGSNKGALHHWLSTFKGEPRIAWYPSAGGDFRDLLYLSKRFSEHMPAWMTEPAPPDLFLHTDYYFHSISKLHEGCAIHFDERTSVVVKSIEELPRCDLPLDPEIVAFPDGSHATGRVLFLEADVSSNVLGDFSAPVIYVFAENGAFCAQRILPNHGKFSHIIHVRHGGGCGGGGMSTGIWMLNILRRTGCECFITDGHLHRQSGDERIYALYPELAGPESAFKLEPIRKLPSVSWSYHGDVSWNIIRPVRNRLRRTRTRRATEA